MFVDVDDDDDGCYCCLEKREEQGERVCITRKGSNIFLRISSSSSRVHRHQYATALLFDSDDCYTPEREKERKRKEQEFCTRSIRRRREQEKKRKKANAFTSSISSLLSNVIVDRILYLNTNNVSTYHVNVEQLF